MKLLRIPSVAVLLAAVFLVETGVFAIVPVLPLYLHERGISYSFAGLIVGANLAAQFLFQYPAGYLSDRVGRRPVMVAGLALAALATAALVLPVPPVALVLVRFLQGTGAAAFIPGAAAALADEVAPERRGEAYGLLNTAFIGGLTVGPGVGGLVSGLAGRQYVFEATAVLVLVDAVVVHLLLPRRLPRPRRPAEGRVARSALGAVGLIWIGGGFLFGGYDLVWPLFMRSFGATDFMIGASFSLFGLPFIVISPFAGLLADRVGDRRWLAVGGMALAGALAPLYPILHSFWPVVLVGVIEAAAVAFADPASMAFLMDASPESQRGRVQGALGAIQFAAQAAGATAGGPLFAISVAAPFLVGSAVCLSAAIVSLPLFRLAGRRAAPAQVEIMASRPPM